MGYLVTSAALVNFNDFEGAPGAGRVDTYQQDLQSMLVAAKELRSPEAQRLVGSMAAQLQDLDEQPQQGVNRSGHGLEKLLEFQLQLDANASAKYEQQALDIDPTTRELHKLSLNIGRALQVYQVRTFRALPSYFLDISEARIRSLDAEINESFAKLRTGAPQLASALTAAQRQYAFVREKLLDAHQTWTPSGVERFLSRCVRSLDQLAVESSGS
ncbi:hypothetical protein JQX08_10090 [Pseudomonas sp. UL073]|uniref:Uncharacterized protein n=1 Tax=Zestomonas insulae TaxID=2809017 RepID=A0ABS2IGI1_9GAMM|nr:hypothetical protein [Pseudomonas insulae]MBM7061057.1 hypothetical protein [Pseudomonas insulae]